MNAYPKPKKIAIAGMSIMAGTIALTYCTAHGAADYIGASGALCLLWAIVFDRPPVGANTVAEVYRASRNGWRSSKSASAMSLLGVLLIGVSFYMKLQH